MKLFSIVVCLILVMLLSSCTTSRTYWQYKAETLYSSLPADWDCKKRVGFLSQELSKKGVKHYIVHGWYGKYLHRWIELEDGTILEPSILEPSKTLYKIEHKVPALVK